MQKIKLLFLLIIVFISGCNYNKNDENKIKLALDYTPNTNYIGVYVAKELGYYDEVGINVELINSSSVSVETLVNTNQANFGYSYSESVLIANQNDLHISSIYTLYNQNLSGFISQKDKNITSINDFSNKTYCGWGDESEEKILKGLMKVNGVDPNSINIVNTDLTFATDVSNKCDIFWSYEGWGNIEAQFAGIEYNYIPLTSLNLNYYTPVLINNTQNIHPKTKEFVKATNKGYVYAKNNIDQAVDIYMKHNPQDNKELIKQSLEVYAPYISDTGYQDPQIWNDFIKFCKENEIITEYNNQGYTNEYVSNP